MTNSLDMLRNIGESLPPYICKPFKRKITWRKKLGRFILGKPTPGSGILVQVDLSRKTKQQVDDFWAALKLFNKAEIYFDTGMGCEFDMEFDWSLTGAVAICKRCGYNSEDNREQLDLKSRKESENTHHSKGISHE